MRVTNNMMANQVIFNVQRSLQRFLDLQNSMSSGRRINRPSDDPLGTVRDLNYRTELSKTGQYRKNVSLGQNWLTTYDGVLNDMGNLLSSAKEVAISMSNDTYDAEIRRLSANEIRSIFDQLVELSNTQLEGRHIFSGFKTKVSPLESTNRGVIYRGDDGRIEFEIQSSKRQAVSITAADTFLKSFSILGEDADLNVGVTANTNLSDLNNGNGVDLTVGTFTITDLNDLTKIANVDLTAAPPATTVGEAIAKVNAQLVADGITNLTVSLSADGNSLFIDTTQTGLISTDTKLARLNDGAGVDLNLGKILVTDGTTDVLVDLSTSETVGDVISEFNTQLVAAGINNVTMAINAAQTGFVVNDTNGPPLDLTIANASTGDDTASLLGVDGFIGASLVGRDLNPEVSFEIAETTGNTAADLGIAGEYSHDSAGSDINPMLAAASELADLCNCAGIEGDEFVIWQGERSFTVDLTDPALVTVQNLIDHINNASGLDVTTSINSAKSGIQIENNDPYRSLMITEGDGSGRAARQMGVYGSGDIMGTLLVLVDALEKNDQEAIGLQLEGLDGAHRHALAQRSTVGSIAMRLERTDSRLADLELSFSRLLSEVEDADLTQVIADLATHENSYQASLMSAAKIIQPSLMDFLRI